MSSGSEPPEELTPAEQRILEGAVAREEARRFREEARLRRDEAVAARGRAQAIRGRSELIRGTPPSRAVEALIHEVEGLTEALATRRVISNAVGLLMAQGQVDRQEAVVQLRRAARRDHRKLREIATEMVEAHERRVRERVAREGAGPS